MNRSRDSESAALAMYIVCVVLASALCSLAGVFLLGDVLSRFTNMPSPADFYPFWVLVPLTLFVVAGIASLTALLGVLVLRLWLRARGENQTR